MSQTTVKEAISRRALKALGLFGGIQSIMVILSVVKTKLVALWLGADGMGLFGIFNSAVDLVSSATQLSLRNSAVRDISAARGSDRLGRITVAVVRWSWLLGLLGAFVMLVGAPMLSHYTFGNDDFTWAYRILSIAVFLNSIQSGLAAVMQGTEQFRRLAKSQLSGAVAGFVISIPLFYFWRIDSVIPSITVYATVTAIAFFLYRQASTKQQRPGWNETLSDGKSFIKLGLYMTVSAFATLLAGYVFMAWLNNTSSTDEVGLFNAGFTLVNRYVGLILGAVATEYYPRLSRIAGNRRKTDLHVSTEIEVGLKVLLPLIIIFLLFDRLIVNLLYAPEFEVIVPFVSWAIVGTLFRFLSWCMAYVILARGDGKIYVVTEVLSSAVYVAVNIMAYSRWGISGMGYAYCAWYVIYLAMVMSVYYFRYGNRLTRRSIVLSAGALATSLLVLWISYRFIGW